MKFIHTTHIESTRSMEKKLTTLLLGLILCVTAALAQTKVSGVVISASDNQPIAGAHIATIGRKQLTVTDDNGKFALTIKGKDTRITVSYIGMESTTVKGGENMHQTQQEGGQFFLHKSFLIRCECV